MNSALHILCIFTIRHNGSTFARVSESIIDDRHKAAAATIHNLLDDLPSQARMDVLRIALNTPPYIYFVGFVHADPFESNRDTNGKHSHSHTHTLCTTVFYQMADDKRKTIIYFHILYNINLWRVDWHESDTCTQRLCGSNNTELYLNRQRWHGIHSPTHSQPHRQTVSLALKKATEKMKKKKGWKESRRWTRKMCVWMEKIRIFRFYLCSYFYDFVTARR